MKYNLNGVRPLGYPSDYPSNKKKVLDLLLEGQNSLETIFVQLTSAAAKLEEVYQNAKSEVGRIPNEPSDPDAPDRPHNITIDFDSLINQCQTLYDNFEVLYNDVQQLVFDCKTTESKMKEKI